MILDTLKSANSIILDSVNATNDKQAAEKFKSQVSSLNTYTIQLEQLLNLHDALKEREYNIYVTDIIKESLQEAVNNCGQKTNDHTLDASTVQTLKNAIELYRALLEAEWKNGAEKKSRSVIDSLSSLRGLLSDKQEADDILSKLDKLKAVLPSLKGIDEFLEQTVRGKEITDNLHVSPEAERFISKVKMQRATVGDLTPEIIAWLNDNGLLDVMKIRF